jgi:phosphotriesterase-related protein
VKLVVDKRQVMTVLGPLGAEQLGVTLPHEHVFCDITCLCPPPDSEDRREFLERPVEMGILGFIRRDPLFNRDNCLLTDVDLAIEEVREFKKLGGGTIVDLTSEEMVGRDPVALRAVARATGVNIVCGCGHYLHFIHPPGAAEESMECIAERLVDELTDGIGDTGVRPGIIGEIGTSDPIHPREAKMLRAAAWAQQKTGAAVTVHCNLGTRTGAEVLRVLDGAGADLSRVVLGHVDFALGHLDVSFEDAVGYHMQLASSGCFIEYDTVGADGYFRGTGAERPFWAPSDRQRADAIARLLDAGFGDQVLISHDICLKHYLLHYGGFGYGHILREFTHNLKDAGVGEADIRRLLVENPAKMLVH